MNSIGIFGGTFDPVHRGHLELAKYAMENCCLTEVIFIPTATPPHKSQKNIASFKHRVEMLRLVIGEDRKYSISTIEKRLTPPNYTFDTLSLLFEHQDNNSDYYFIIGIDAFLEIKSWKNAEKVLEGIHFIVSARDGYSPESFQKFIESLNYSKTGSFWYNTKSGRKIYYLDAEIPGISSSTVRKNIRNIGYLKELIDPRVLSYIKKNHLYEIKEEPDMH